MRATQARLVPVLFCFLRNFSASLAECNRSSDRLRKAVADRRFASLRSRFHLFDARPERLRAPQARLVFVLSRFLCNFCASLANAMGAATAYRKAVVDRRCSSPRSRFHNFDARSELLPATQARFRFAWLTLTLCLIFFQESYLAQCCNSGICKNSFRF